MNKIRTHFNPLCQCGVCGGFLHDARVACVVAVAPRTGKTTKNGVFGRGEDLLQNGILHFNSQITIWHVSVQRRVPSGIDCDNTG